MKQSRRINPLKDNLEQQETRVEAQLRNACQSNEPLISYRGYSYQLPIHTSPYNQETSHYQGPEIFANQYVPYDSSNFFQLQSETDIAIPNEDLALGGPSLQVGHENNETYSVDHASLISNPPDQTFTVRSRNSAGDSILCPECNELFLHDSEYK